MKRKLMVAAIGAIVPVAVVLGTASVAHAAGDYSVSIASWCARNVSSGNPYVASQAVNINNLWNGWRCAETNGTLASVNVAQACTQQYPGRGAVAVLVNQSWSGWRCRF